MKKSVAVLAVIAGFAASALATPPDAYQVGKGYAGVVMLGMTPDDVRGIYVDVRSEEFGYDGGSNPGLAVYLPGNEKAALLLDLGEQGDRVMGILVTDKRFKVAGTQIGVASTYKAMKKAITTLGEPYFAEGPCVNDEATNIAFYMDKWNSSGNGDFQGTVPDSAKVREMFISSYPQ